jgi:hypothetical protein
MGQTIATFPEPDAFGRQVTLISVDGFADVLPLPKLATEHYTLLPVMDGLRESAGSLGEIPDELLRQGLVYLCAWGPECERVHDIFDEVAVNLEIKTGISYPLMSTWHEHESLEQTLWYFLNLAEPDKKYEKCCGSALVVSVASNKWSNQLRMCLLDIAACNKRVLNSDANNG